MHESKLETGAAHAARQAPFTHQPTLYLPNSAALVYHGQGNVTGTQENPANIGDIQNVMGLLFSSAVFVGMFNALTVQPLVAAERVVFYRGGCVKEM